MAKALVDAGLESARVYTIDLIPHDQPRNWHLPKHPDTDPAARKQLSRAELLSEFEQSLVERITFLCDDSGQLLSEWASDVIDFAFLDGDHTYEGVKADIEALLPHLAANAIVVFDDYGPSRTSHRWRNWVLSGVGHPGVRKAVDELFEAGGWVFHYPRTPDFDRVAILQRLCTE